MSPRLASLRALLKRPRAVPAALLLAVSMLATLAGPVHLAFDAQDHEADDHGHANRAPAHAAFEAGCPADCSDPHHAHRAHDHATCPTCRTFGAAFLPSSPVAPVAPDRQTLADADLASRALSRATESPAARGPPVSLSTTAAS